jgi:hypothetical protein
VRLVGLRAGVSVRSPRRDHLGGSFLRVAVCAVSVVAEASILACRPDPKERPAAAMSPTTTPPATPVMNRQQDSVSLELVLPRSVPAGKPVQIRLRVQNLTERSIDLYLRGRTTTFDVVVSRSGGEIVWQRLEDEIIPAIVHLRTLAPAERFELVAVWDQLTKQGKRVEPGDYTARALLLTEGEPLETPSTPFRIARQ